MALQVWLPLNGNLNNQGLSTGSLSAGSMTFEDGKLGKCLRVNSNTTGAATFPGIQNASKWSICLWLKLSMSDSVSSNWNDFFTIGMNNNGATSGGFRIEHANTAGIFQCITPKVSGYNNNNGYYAFYSNNSAAKDQWCHLAIINDGTSYRQYLNGALVSTIANTSFSETGSSILTGTLSLGMANAYCWLNDFRIYDHALSPREVAELAKGLVLHYPLNRDGFGNDNFYSATGIGPCGAGITSYTNDGYEHHSVWNKGGTARAQNLGFNGKTGPWTVSFDVKASVNCSISVDVCDKAYATSAYGNDLVANKWTHKSYTITTATNQYNTSGNYNGFVDFNLSGSAIVEGTTLDIKNLHVEEGTIETPFIPASGTTAYTAMGVNSTTVPDTSGYGNNGMITGTLSYSGDTPRYGVSTVLPNSCATYIKATGLKQQIFTWSCWFKIVGQGAGSSQRILSEGRDTGSRGVEIWTSKDGLTLYCCAHNLQSNTTIALNTWYHVVVVCDGTSSKFYLNGTQFYTGTYSADVDYAQSSDAFVIGKMAYSYTNASNYFPLNGQVSDVRIYATALSADDVKALYNTPISLANNGTLFAQEFVEG